MDTHDLHLPEHHQTIMDRFIAACQADERIVAACVLGSYATGRVDRYSDLDLCVITTDEAYEGFLASRERFIRLLGEPLFRDDFGFPYCYLTIYSNGAEADFVFYREGNYQVAPRGPYRVLLDRKGILNGGIVRQQADDQAKRQELLRQQVEWFWHDLSHFIKAMGRRQLWFAYGELEVLRQMCVNLARLHYNYADPYFGEEPYWKIEDCLPDEQLAPLEKTICPLEYGAMLQAALALFRFYQSVAPALAAAHGVPYQVRLERMMLSRLEGLAAAGTS